MSPPHYPSRRCTAGPLSDAWLGTSMAWFLTASPRNMNSSIFIIISIHSYESKCSTVWLQTWSSGLHLVCHASKNSSKKFETQSPMDTLLLPDIILSVLALHTCWMIGQSLNKCFRDSSGTSTSTLLLLMLVHEGKALLIGLMECGPSSKISSKMVWRFGDADFSLLYIHHSWCDSKQCHLPLLHCSNECFPRYVSIKQVPMCLLSMCYRDSWFPPPWSVHDLFPSSARRDPLQPKCRFLCLFSCHSLLPF